ncbi:MAG: serine hydrolase domain-containing protein [Acidimicrobiia bacterium]
MSVLLVMVVVVVGAAACAGSEPASSTSSADAESTTSEVPSTTTSAPASTTTIGQPPTVDEVLAQAVESVILPDGSGSALVAIVARDGTVDFAARGETPSGTVLTPEDFFRAGSITKTLTAAAVMTLVDDGLVELDSAASNYVARVPVDGGVMVRDLLQHTSGIPDYTQSDEFFGEVYGDTSRVWTPEEITALVAGRSDFDPGSAWEYSNTNYVILGTLVEEITGRSFHEVLRESVLVPSDGADNYVAHFEAGTEPASSYTVRVRSTPVDFDFTSIATAAWASGASVANVEQLAASLGSIFGGEIIGTKTLEAMTEPVPWETTFYGLPAAYGLGVFRLSETQFAHDGAIPGFLTAYAHDTSTGATAIWVVTNDGATIPRPSFAAVLAQLSSD